MINLLRKYDINDTLIYEHEFKSLGDLQEICKTLEQPLIQGGTEQYFRLFILDDSRQVVHMTAKKQLLSPTVLYLYCKSLVESIQPLGELYVLFTASDISDEIKFFPGDQKSFTNLANTYLQKAKTYANSLQELSFRVAKQYATGVQVFVDKNNLAPFANISNFYCLIADVCNFLRIPRCPSTSKETFIRYTLLDKNYKKVYEIYNTARTANYKTILDKILEYKDSKLSRGYGILATTIERNGIVLRSDTMNIMIKQYRNAHAYANLLSYVQLPYVFLNKGEVPRNERNK